MNKRILSFDEFIAESQINESALPVLQCCTLQPLSKLGKCVSNLIGSYPVKKYIRGNFFYVDLQECPDDYHLIDDWCNTNLPGHYKKFDLVASSGPGPKWGWVVKSTKDGKTIIFCTRSDEDHAYFITGGVFESKTINERHPDVHITFKPGLLAVEADCDICPDQDPEDFEDMVKTHMKKFNVETLFLRNRTAELDGIPQVMMVGKKPDLQKCLVYYCGGDRGFANDLMRTAVPAETVGDN